MTAKELETGTHFWAEFINGGTDNLVMMMKDKQGKYFVCGGWECDIDEKEFRIIEVIQFPKNYNKSNLSYYK